MKQRVTLKMIATEVGLSVQAVSMALRDHQDIALGTRERIRQKANELGYLPDPGLRALSDYRTRQRGVSTRWNQIAVVHNWASASTRIESTFHVDWLRHITRSAKSRGIDLSTHWLGSQGERTKTVFRRLRNQGITGVFVAPPGLTPEEPRVEIPRGPFQVVTFGPGHLYPDHHTVQFDFYENLRLAWRVLHARGRRRIGLIHHKRQGWRTSHAWQAAHYVEKTLAGHAPGDLPPLELAANGGPEENEAYLAWVKQHRVDAVISSVYELPEWNTVLENPPELAIFNVEAKGGQGIDLNVDQMAETAVELLLMEMQRSLVDRAGLPFRVHIPGKWVDA